MKLIAGHEFPDTRLDSNCIKDNHGENCKATRAFLFTVTSEEVGKTGYAHTLALNASEYSEICIAREEYIKHCERIMEATHMVSG